MGPGMAGPGMGAAQNARGNQLFGVTLLGKGTSKELLEQAQDKGLDVLVMFQVEVAENRKTSLVVNETNIVLWDVKKGVEFAKTKPLNNIAVQKKRDEDKDEKPIEATLDSLFKDLGAEAAKGVKLREFPAEIVSEHVKERVLAILSVDTADRLSVLAEIKFYHSRGLIDDATLTKSFQKILGELDGAKLAQGKEKERLEVVEGLLPRES